MAAAITPTLVAFCVCVLLMSGSIPTVSGAWPWEVGLPKNRTSTTAEVPASSSPNVATDAPASTTLAPPTADSTPRPRSRPRSHSKKHHSHTSTTPQPATADSTEATTTTTEAPAPSAPPAAVQTQPPSFAPVQSQLPPMPPPEMSPIVIVEPDSYAGAGRAYRSMYEQPYGGMYAPPMPYPPPMPYYSPPPPMAPYPAPYDPYSVVAYPSYQWPPIEPSYLRPYRSFPLAPVPTLGSYPSDYSPFPWWKPPAQGLSLDGPVAAATQGGCSSEPQRDREELTPTPMDAPADQKVEEPSPTHISLLPSYTSNVGSQNNNREDGNVPKQKPYLVEEKVEQPNTATGNNGYGTGDSVGRENHILRNNPYQPALSTPYWPGYYEQSQWPQVNQWQQWPGPQQPQYPYGVAPQQPSVVPSQKRQATGYGWAGRPYA